MNIDLFLTKLDRVKSTGSNKWIALCPAHKEKTPSLAIRLIDGDRLLFHCFGCGANGIDICEALGINPAELFPEKDINSRRERTPFPADQILAAIASEAGIVSTASAMIAKGEALSSIDADRVELARSRIMEALNYAKT